jgi:Rad3-related DNA helicase
MAYDSEVKLSIAYPFKQFQFKVEGRADGILSKKGSLAAVEEIKSTLKPLRLLENNPDHWHWAQAKCYAYICCAQDGLESVDVWLTYGNLDTGDWAEFKNTFAFSDLEFFFEDLIERYWAFAKMDHERILERNVTAKPLPFPFSKYRSGQRELCVSAYAAIKGRKKLFAQAPTGTGKTVSALYPSVKALAEGMASKIFYCTAKTVTRQVAEETLRLMEGKGLSMRSITLTAKDKICLLGKCDPQSCACAKGHFDRVNEAILDTVATSTIITRERLLEAAAKHNVCPFELSLDLCVFCDAIICDYNHVFDPKAKLKRFFTDGGDYVILVDESHNLADRARDMFSADLSKEEFESAKKEFPKGSGLRRLSGGIAKEIQSFADKNRPDGEPLAYSAKSGPQDLMAMLADFAAEANETLQKEPSDRLMELYFRSMDFLRISELYDSKYTTFVELGKQKASVKLFCLDPSSLLNQATEQCLASVLFSATLTPLPYFRQILGGSEKDYILKLKSPFPQENLCLIADRRISTKYKDRAQSVAPVAKALRDLASSRKGNYIAFFPSYDYMGSVLEKVRELAPSLPIIAQTASMDEKSRERFLEMFSPDNEDTLLGFAVLGGVFSEGIDLKSDRLIGAAIIGVGLPLICPQRDAIANYYQETGKSGFDYAYVYPGMNKVLQAAGRVIRSETDRGAVLLIDSRYARADYKGLFPPEWSHCLELAGNSSAREALEKFWERSENLV